MAPVLEPHNSASPEFCQDLRKAWVRQGGATTSWEGGTARSWRVKLLELLWWQGTGQAYGKLGRMAPSPQPQDSLSGTPWICLDLYILDPGSWLLYRVWASQGGDTVILESGSLVFFQADALCRVVLHPRKMVPAVWERDSAQGLCSCLFSSLPVTTNPASRHMTIPVALSLPEPRINGCKWDFVHCPFKKSPESPADTCLAVVDRIPADFSQPDIMWAHLPGSGALGWGD